MILVTGSAGLVGSHLVRGLVRKGEVVVSIDDLSGGLEENIVDENGHVFHQFNLLNYERLEGVFGKYRPEIVCSVGAVATEGASHFRKKFIFDNNLVINLNLINCAINYEVRKFVFFSSMATYGGYKKPPFDESDFLIPEDSYGNAKVAVERELKITHDFFKTPVYSIMKPHNIYGIGQNIFDKFRNVIGIWIRQGLLGQPITVFGDGLQMRAFSNIKDSTPAFIKAVLTDRADLETVNVGGTKPYTILETAEIVQKHFPDSPIQHLEPRYEVKHAWCTYEKSQQLLDYEDTISLEDGIAEMVEWAKTLPMREIQEWDNFEIEKNLYSFWKK